MPKIKIASGRGLISVYDYGIYLDGEIIGILPMNGKREFDVPEGKHMLKAKFRFFGSQDYSFTLLNKDSRSFTISENIVLNMLILIFITFIAALQAFTDLNRGILLGLIITGLVYFLVIRRNAFLIINEE